MEWGRGLEKACSGRAIFSIPHSTNPALPDTPLPGSCGMLQAMCQLALTAVCARCLLCCAVLCHLASFTTQETASNAVPRSGAALGHWVDDGTAPDGQGVVYLRRVVESHRHALEAAALATQYCAGTWHDMH